MQKYAHIGYAKAASTWLQFFLFPHHPDLYHLGRSGGDVIIDVDMRLALWNDLITRPALLYEPGEVVRTFERHFAEAAASGAIACGISQEALTMSLVGTLDITERARRLRLAMGDDTRIIIVVRNQIEWIVSVFCGLLKEGGMPLGLDDFLFYFYYQQDQSPFSTLFYDDVYEVYGQLFGQDNIHVIPFERIVQDPSAFAAEICGAIGVRPLEEVPAGSLNRRPSSQALTGCLEFNRRNTFYLGGNHFRRPWAFAVEPMYEKRFGIVPPAWIAEERSMSMFAFERMEAVVQEAEKSGEPIAPMDMTIPVAYQDLLIRAYAPHNRRLQQITGLDLASLGYPL